MATVRDSDTLTVRSGDVRLAVYLSGPRNAPPVILVHGCACGSACASIWTNAFA